MRSLIVSLIVLNSVFAWAKGPSPSSSAFGSLKQVLDSEYEKLVSQISKLEKLEERYDEVMKFQRFLADEREKAHNELTAAEDSKKSKDVIAELDKIESEIVYTEVAFEPLFLAIMEDNFLKDPKKLKSACTEAPEQIRFSEFASLPENAEKKLSVHGQRAVDFIKMFCTFKENKK